MFRCHTSPGTSPGLTSGTSPASDSTGDDSSQIDWSRCDRSRRKKSGFTLVELMVVVVILGTLIALVGPDIWNMLFESNVSAAETQMSNFGQAIDNFRLQNKKLPGSLDELTETTGRNPHPFIQSIPQDPWGNDYEYRVLDRNKFKIISYGEDGQADTEDDITYPREEE